MKYIFVKTFFKFILFIIVITFSNSQSSNNYYLFKYNQLYYSKKFILNSSRVQILQTKFSCDDPAQDCAGNGTCLPDKSGCTCNAGYITPPKSYIKCIYVQKSNTIALLLEGTIGFGFGHLYLQNYTFFIGKFLFYLFSCYCNFCIFIFVGSMNNSNVDEYTYTSTKRSAIILVPIMIAWYFFDVAMFLMRKYTDSNSMILY